MILLSASILGRVVECWRVLKHSGNAWLGLIVLSTCLAMSCYASILECWPIPAICLPSKSLYGWRRDEQLSALNVCLKRYLCLIFLAPTMRKNCGTDCIGSGIPCVSTLRIYSACVEIKGWIDWNNKDWRRRWLHKKIWDDLLYKGFLRCATSFCVNCKPKHCWTSSPCKPGRRNASPPRFKHEQLLQLPSVSLEFNLPTSKWSHRAKNKHRAQEKAWGCYKKQRDTGKSRGT